MESSRAASSKAVLRPTINITSANSSHICIVFLVSVSTLLLGIGVVLLGAGMLSTLLGMRASISGFSPLSAGLIMSGYFVGYIIGTYQCPGLIPVSYTHLRAHETDSYLV